MKLVQSPHYTLHPASLINILNEFGTFGEYLTLMRCLIQSRFCMHLGVPYTLAPFILTTVLTDGWSSLCLTRRRTNALKVKQHTQIIYLSKWEAHSLSPSACLFFIC